MKFRSQCGVALYLTLMIMTILLAIAFGLSSIFLGQVDVMKGLGNSVIAFYAADIGIEEVIADRGAPSSVCTEASPCALGNGAVYYVSIIPAGPNCEADHYCVRSIGVFQETRRAIEVSY